MMHSRLVVLFGALAIAATACGGDKGGGSGDAATGGTGGGNTGGTGGTGGAMATGGTGGTGGMATGGGGGSTGTGGAAGGGGRGGSAGTGGAGGTIGTGGAGGSGGVRDGGTDTAGMTGADGRSDTPPATGDKTMSFFASSTGVGLKGDFGGLAGADKHCDTLAKAAGSMNKKWVAYLSADVGPGGTPLNARDRVAGGGPWYDSLGRLIALDVTALHTQPRPAGDKAATDDLFDENKKTVGDAHDITTGSNPDGSLKPNFTCKSWTSVLAADHSQVGHSNLRTAGQNTMSWNSSHVNGGPGCDDLRPGGGIGRVYCFAMP